MLFSGCIYFQQGTISIETNNFLLKHKTVFIRSVKLTVEKGLKILTFRLRVSLRQRGSVGRTPTRDRKAEELQSTVASSKSLYPDISSLSLGKDGPCK